MHITLQTLPNFLSGFRCIAPFAEGLNCALYFCTYYPFRPVKIRRGVDKMSESQARLITFAPNACYKISVMLFHFAIRSFQMRLLSKIDAKVSDCLSQFLVTYMSQPMMCY